MKSTIKKVMSGSSIRDSLLFEDEPKKQFSLQEAEASIKGQKIVDVRFMTEAEMSAEGWEGLEAGGAKPVVLVLDSGLLIYPSQDFEGNGPGVLFGTDGKQMFGVMPNGDKEDSEKGNGEGEE